MFKRAAKSTEPAWQSYLGELTQAVEEDRLGERVADAARGRPDVDLRDYAAARGLSFRDNADISGYLAALPVEVSQRFNVMTGILPGGQKGILFHEVKDHLPGTLGFFYAKKGRQGSFTAPYTTAAMWMPEAAGALFRLQVARKRERPISSDRYWHTEDLGVFGLERWQLAVAPQADRTVLDALLAGAVREAIGDAPPLGFEISFVCGTLIVLEQGYLKRPDELDAMAKRASRVGEAVRSACMAAARPLPFSTALPAPVWLTGPDESENPDLRLGEAKITFGGKRLAAITTVPGLEVPVEGDARQWVEGMIRTRGLELEDPVAFHRAFPDLPRTGGQAFAVLRGELPDTGVQGRLVAYAERRLQLPHSGSHAALVPLPPGVPDAPGELIDQLGVARIHGGVLSLDRMREAPGLDGDDLDRLAVEAVGLARSRGLIPSAA